MNFLKFLQKNRVLKTAKDILSTPTAPFQEEFLISYLKNWARQHALSFKQDNSGNVIIFRQGIKKSPSPLILTAHLDHPGFQASDGKWQNSYYFFKAFFRGGVKDAYFPKSHALFLTQKGPAKATILELKHLKNGNKLITLKSKKEVPKNSMGMWDLIPFKKKGNILFSRAIDDLGGTIAILSLLQIIDKIDPHKKVDIRGLFTRAEEVGFIGAIGAAKQKIFSKDARIISIETSKALPNAPQGKGPIVRVGDRISLFNDELTRSLVRLGQKLEKQTKGKFKWQRKLMDGGACEGTAFQAFGYKTAAMCIPLGNYHNMGPKNKIKEEYIDIADLMGLIRFFMIMAEEERHPTQKPLLSKQLIELYNREKRSLFPVK